MNKKQTIRINENQLRKIVTEYVKRVLKESQGGGYNKDGMLIIRRTTPEEFNNAKMNGRIKVNGEYNGYLIINWDNRWYYMDTQTGDLCDPNVVHKMSNNM